MSTGDLSFPIHPDDNNRWVKLSREMQWGELEEIYKRKVDPRSLHPDNTCRAVLAALVIKYRLALGNGETIRLISENPYMQYFLGNDNYAAAINLRPHTLDRVKQNFTKEEWYVFKRVLLKGVSSQAIQPKASEQERPRPAETDKSPADPAAVTEHSSSHSHHHHHRHHHHRQKKREERKKKRVERKLKKLGKNMYTYFLVFIFLGVLTAGIIILMSQIDLKDKRLIEREKKAGIRR